MKPLAFRPIPILAALTAAAFVLRAAAPGHAPPGLNSDELLKAFDGASVYRTGMDHHGDAWPLFFKQSGEYSPPLYIYFSGLFSLAFGIHPLSVRLPSAILGTLAVPLTYLIARRAVSNNLAAAAAALAALSPWSIHFSRIGWEAILQSPLHLAGVWLLIRWNEDRKPAELVLSAFCFALTLYAYPAARVFTPLFLLAACLAFRNGIRRYPKHFFWALAVFLLVSIPFVYESVLHRGAMEARWRFLSVFQYDNGFARMAVSYVSHLSPMFLFFTGSHYGHMGGMSLAVLAPFFALGLFRCAYERTPFQILLIAWFLLFALPSSMTHDRFDPLSMPNPLRSSCGMMMPELIAILGADWARGKIRRMRCGGWLAGAAAFAVLANFAVVAFDYAARYPVRSAGRWQFGLREAVEYIEANKDGYDRVVVSHNVRLHPVSLAVFAGLPPRPFGHDDFPKYVVPFYHYAPVYGEFGHREYERHGTIGRWYHLGSGKRLLLAKGGELLDAVPVYAVKNPDGSPAYEIFDAGP